MPSYNSERYGHDEWAVPDTVRKFLSSLHKQVKERNHSDVFELYQNQLPKLTERYFKASAWPNAELIESIVEHDETFLSLYQELYYRHIFCNRDLVPTLQDRVDSFNNYIRLLNILLEQSDDGSGLELPLQWLWDILDEFVNQFEEFHSYRCNFSDLENEEIDFFREHSGTWSCQVVLRYLHALVLKGRVTVRFNPEVDDSIGAVSKNCRMTSIFAVISLSHVHVLLGDYQTALEVLAPIDDRMRVQLSQVYSCFVTTYYVMGFAYLMLHRFLDAIKTFSMIVSHASRNKKARHLSHDATVHNVERMQVLLAMAQAVCSVRIEESALNVIKEEYGDEMQEMDAGSVETFKKMFKLGSPNFVAPAMPSFIEGENEATGIQEQQLDIFLREIKQRQLMESIDQFLKLYTTISIPKLSRSLKLSEDKLINQLLSLKHRTRNLRWTGDAPAEGTHESSSSLDFYVADNVVNVVYSKPPRRHREYFFRNIRKLRELQAEVERIN